MKTFNYRLRRALVGAALAAFGAAALVQTYPDKPIQVVVPSSPGGSPDVLARLIADPMGDELGQTLVIETLPGAAGIIGTEKVAKSAPDGYSLRNAAIVKVIHRPDMQQQIRDLGYEPLGSSPKEMADRIHAELAEWTTIIRQAHIRLDQQ